VNRGSARGKRSLALVWLSAPDVFFALPVGVLGSWLVTVLLSNVMLEPKSFTSNVALRMKL
jgi:hypothetical protein